MVDLRSSKKCRIFAPAFGVGYREEASGKAYHSGEVLPPDRL